MEFGDYVDNGLVDGIDSGDSSLNFGDFIFYKFDGFLWFWWSGVGC